MFFKIKRGYPEARVYLIGGTPIQIEVVFALSLKRGKSLSK